jgi:hypothetical protein
LTDLQHAGKDNAQDEASSRNSIPAIYPTDIFVLVYGGFRPHPRGDYTWGEEGIAGELPSPHGMGSRPTLSFFSHFFAFERKENNDLP